jgi:L-alanine-DL-glutamate epimerase-like enolase superfamily enzyme
VTSVRYENGHLVVPEGPGLGVEIDRDRVDRYGRRW